MLISNKLINLNKYSRAVKSIKFISLKWMSSYTLDIKSGSVMCEAQQSFVHDGVDDGHHHTDWIKLLYLTASCDWLPVLFVSFVVINWKLILVEIFCLFVYLSVCLFVLQPFSQFSFNLNSDSTPIKAVNFAFFFFVKQNCWRDYRVFASVWVCMLELYQLNSINDLSGLIFVIAVSPSFLLLFYEIVL